MSVFDIDAFLAGLLASHVFIHGARMERATLFYDDYATNDAKIETIVALLLFFLLGTVGCVLRRFAPDRVVRYATWAALVLWVVSTAGVGYSFNPTDVRNAIVPVPMSVAERVTALVCKHTTAGFFFFSTLVDAFAFPRSLAKITLVSVVMPLNAVFWSSALSFGSGGYIYVDRMAFVCGVVACVVRFLLVNAPDSEPAAPSPEPDSRKREASFFAAGLLHAVIVCLFTSFAFIPLLPFHGTDTVTHFWGFFIGALATVTVPGPSSQDAVALVAMVVLTGLCAAGATGFFWGSSTGAIWTWATMQPARKPSAVRCEEWMALLCVAGSTGSAMQFGLLASGVYVGNFGITILSTAMLTCAAALCALYVALGWTGVWWY